MKRLIPIAILVLVLTTGCLRKPERYESMRNMERAESVKHESTEQAKPEDSKPEDTTEKPASENTDSNKPEEFTEKTMKVTPDILNMRSEASTNSSIVTKLKKNDELKVIEETKDDDGATWVKVDFNGQVGFVSKEFLGE
ncbi:MAG: SH3 domain-containing protein [Finegoldia magna]|uniref:SH3 domain-containing protein n=1 Tax=Finegoldia magna TaxID=1260 RepID=UPI0025F21BDF|nr:SH3 domain-containing protein [Finegoldia magna]MBS5777515.1 SH3 domain-containing protein [Finegoldia magna]MDU2575911.1 SH3 domain-containing protein [Finegoldia magna]MDU7479724.1 SH3 domain-containing protein [Finegoldia magna]